VSTFKEIGLFAWIIGVIIIPVCGFFLVRYINQIDKKIDDLYDKLGSIKESFDQLLGEHNAVKEFHKID